jgi:hypothetical protein
MLIAHISIALFSLVLTTFLYFSPSRTKLSLSYLLVALTFLTGTYLIIFNQADILRTCLTGLVYLGVVAVSIVSARNKLLNQI